ncbi:DsbA family oxidoreductase [Nocardiopsis changdeensis]|uniref:DsbA family protein n=1 Tax=Nocardiopsis changdeensis TaxID=2831969 RepID=A0ABX8BU23_9ACTN|nr:MULTISPECIES: DsbA family protein [Nocardiopsis]QUX25757.1 DsbA family protein [Nocardiopsis changdeensis]QYX40222.1 DsbA family protein [Nocardiopsis sp. MT53]
MRLEIWADVVCPWAYIGKRRVERALAARGGEPVEVVWRPYRIDPTAPERARPLDGLLRDPFVDTALRACAPHLSPEQNRVRVAEVAAAEGFPRWGAAWHVSPHGAHRLLYLAEREGGPALQGAVAEEVMRIHFVEAGDIGSAEVLERAADRAGFADGGRLLRAGEGDREVRELLLRGRARGVRTSPTLLVGDLALEGARHPEEIGVFLDRAGERPARSLPAEVERLHLAEALVEKDPLGALALLEPLLAEYGDDRGVRLAAARARLRSAQVGRARRDLEALVAERPDDSHARLMLASALRRGGEPEAAAVQQRLAEALG